MIINYLLVLKENQKNSNKLFPKSTFLQRLTLFQLSIKYNKSIPWIINQFLEHDLGQKVHNLRAINLIWDATFYGKKKDILCTLVFKDVSSKEIIIWKHIQSETVKKYINLKNELVKFEYTITNVILDCKFNDIPKHET